MVWVSIYWELRIEKQNVQAVKLSKYDKRIPIIQLARFRSKKPNENETERRSRMAVLIQELGSILDRKMVETFYVSYKLNCDQLLNMHHTQKLDINRKK